MQNFSLKEIIDLFKENWKLMMIITLLIALGGTIYTLFFIPKVYTSSATLMLGIPKAYVGGGQFDEGSSDRPINASELNYNKQLIGTYSTVVKSRAVLEQVTEEIGYPVSSGMISLIALNDTEILQLTASANNPEKAAEIANITVNVFMEYIADMLKIDNVQVMDQALPNSKPVSPNIRNNIMTAFLAGLILSILLVLIKDLLDTKIRSIDIVKDITKTPVLGVVPISPEIATDIITIRSPKSVISESFRTMRTNTSFAEVDRNIKVITISSTEKNEGKTTIVSNYAVTLTQMGKKVIIVDCDLRRPSIQRFFKRNEKIGLTNVLIDSNSVEEAIVTTDIPGLSLMLSGPVPPNPSEMLGSNRMIALIEELKEEFDYILIDTPPIGVVTDAMMLSKETDGYILVVSIGQVEKKGMEQLVEMMNNAGAVILGTLINKVPVNNSRYRQYGYYYGEYDRYDGNYKNLKFKKKEKKKLLIPKEEAEIFSDIENEEDFFEAYEISMEKSIPEAEEAQSKTETDLVNKESEADFEEENIEDKCLNTNENKNYE